MIDGVGCILEIGEEMNQIRNNINKRQRLFALSFS